MEFQSGTDFSMAGQQVSMFGLKYKDLCVHFLQVRQYLKNPI